MKIYTILILGFLTLFCSTQKNLIDFQVFRIEIKNVSNDDTYWQTIRIIEEHMEIEQIKKEINSSISFKKEKFTKYPPSFYEIVINDSLILGFMPDKKTFCIDDNFYRLNKKLKVLENL